MKTVRIISDGTSKNTKIFDTETGQEVKGVTALEITLTAGETPARAKLEFLKPEIDIVAEVVEA